MIPHPQVSLPKGRVEKQRQAQTQPRGANCERQQRSVEPDDSGSRYD